MATQRNFVFRAVGFVLNTEPALVLKHTGKRWLADLFGPQVKMVRRDLDGHFGFIHTVLLGNSIQALYAGPQHKMLKADGKPEEEEETTTATTKKKYVEETMHEATKTNAMEIGCIALSSAYTA